MKPGAQSIYLRLAGSDCAGCLICQPHEVNVTASVGFRPGKEAIPKAIARVFRLVYPGEMAILAVKFFWKNLQGEKNPGQRRCEKFAGQLRILEPR